ncbi:hypothetical protein AAG906_018832 [Vitis piasezkii]
MAFANPQSQRASSSSSSFSIRGWNYDLSFMGMMKSFQEEKRLICLIILSENYARSRWCLEELTKIMDCGEQMGKLVFPIFYHVEPMHVRGQIRSYGEALADHERNARWRAALTMVAGITGWWLKNR